MAEVSIEFKGFDKIEAMLDPVRFVQEMDRTVDLMGQELRDYAKTLPPVSAKRTGYEPRGIPVDTGRLRQSIEKRKTQLLAVDVAAATAYSKFVHDGTGRMPPRPFFVWSAELDQDRLTVILEEGLRRVVTP